MNIFYLKNIFDEHSKNEKLNYLQTVKIDSSTYSPPPPPPTPPPGKWRPVISRGSM